MICIKQVTSAIYALFYILFSPCFHFTFHQDFTFHMNNAFIISKFKGFSSVSFTLKSQLLLIFCCPYVIVTFSLELCFLFLVSLTYSKNLFVILNASFWFFPYHYFGNSPNFYILPACSPSPSEYLFNFMVPTKN